MTTKSEQIRGILGSNLPQDVKDQLVNDLINSGNGNGINVSSMADGVTNVMGNIHAGLGFVNDTLTSAAQAAGTVNQLRSQIRFFTNPIAAQTVSQAQANAVAQRNLMDAQFQGTQVVAKAQHELNMLQLDQQAQMPPHLLWQQMTGAAGFAPAPVEEESSWKKKVEVAGWAFAGTVVCLGIYGGVKMFLNRDTGEITDLDGNVIDATAAFG